MSYIKGQSVKVFYTPEGGGQTELLNLETSCSVSLQANTVDASSKGFTDAEYDHPVFDDYEGSFSVDGHIDDVIEARTLLTLMQGGDLGGIVIQDETDQCPDINADGAILTSLDITFPSDGLVTASISGDMTGAITISNE